jgi:hypothetical protein
VGALDCPQGTGSRALGSGSSGAQNSVAAWATVGTTRIVETITAANITRIFIFLLLIHRAAGSRERSFFASPDLASEGGCGNLVVLD